MAWRAGPTPRARAARRGPVGNPPPAGTVQRAQASTAANPVPPGSPGAPPSGSGPAPGSAGPLTGGTGSAGPVTGGTGSAGPSTGSAGPPDGGQPPGVP